MPTRHLLQETWCMACGTASNLNLGRLRFHKAYLLLALAASLVPSRACFAQLYKWTDGGKTHYSDQPPSHRDAQILRIPTPPPTPAPSRTGPPPNPEPPAETLDPARAPPLQDQRTGQKPELPTRDSSCESAWRQYMVSQACFMPYRRRNGSLREEAWTVCNDVPDPNPRCGPAPIQDVETSR